MVAMMAVLRGVKKVLLMDVTMVVPKDACLAGKMVGKMVGKKAVVTAGKKADRWVELMVEPMVESMVEQLVDWLVVLTADQKVAKMVES